MEAEGWRDGKSATVCDNRHKTVQDRVTRHPGVELEGTAPAHYCQLTATRRREFKYEVPGRSTTFQWMGPHLGLFGQHKLASGLSVFVLFCFYKDTVRKVGRWRRTWEEIGGGKGINISSETFSRK